MKTVKRLLHFIKSMRVRLVLALALFAVIPTVVTHVTVLKAYEDHAISIRKSDILSQAKIMSDQIFKSRYLNNPTVSSINSRLELFCNIHDGRILLVDETFRIIKDTYDMDTGKIIISEEVSKSFNGETTDKYSSKNRYIQVSLPIVDSEDNKTVTGVLLVSVSSDVVRDMSEYLSGVLLITDIAAFLTAFILAAILSGFFVRPFKNMARSIEEIQTGYGQDSIMIKNYSETEDISKNLNAMLGRMKVIDDSRQEFVSNVSHELKTPLTSMKVLADSLMAQEGVPVELYQEFMTDIAAEIERENKIISDLLSLVKMDKSAANSLEIANENINELIENILKRISPIAEKAGIDLVLESFRPVTAEVDATKLSLAFSNLIENGVKYNDKPDGWVHVSLNADHQYFYVKVEDNGLGIPEESLDHIYERFYRADKSHSREIGGTGLGLSITRKVILLHRGAIKVFSTVGEGTIFTVRIPLNYITKA